MSSDNSTSQSSDFEILTASILPSQYPTFLRNKLHPLLPWSLPLYRRCQFFLHNLPTQPQQGPSPHRPGEPELWIGLSRPKSQSTTNSSKQWLDSWLLETQKIPSSADGSDATAPVWIACHIDLREPGQTQIWTFSSWEPIVSPLVTTTTTTISSSQPTSNPSDPSPQQILLGHKLFHHIRTHHIPALPTTPSQQYLTLKASGKLVSEPFKRSKILFGAISEANYWLLEDDIVRGITPSLTSNSTERTHEVIAREDRGYYKYLIPLPLPPSQPNPPTSSSTRIRPGPLQRSHLQTVLDRTPIPRTLELLSTLVSIGLFPHDSPDPIAWGLLGKDASISSVHTEPEYRGQRLAGVVARELIEATPTGFWTPGEEGEGDAVVGWAHADVSRANVASRKVFERMGARVGWCVSWVEVDVEV